MTDTKNVLSYTDKEITASQKTNKKEEIKNTFTTDYYGSFDDGNHPGQYDVYEAAELNKTEKAPNMEIISEEKTPKETVLGENDFLVDEHVEPEIFSRLEANQDKLPWNLILEKLKKHQTVSCELFRRPKETGKGWNVAVGPAGWFEYIGLGEIFTMKKEKVEGNIALYLTFHPTKTDPLTLQISAKLVEFPNRPKGDMINQGIVFSKTLKGKEFEQENKI